MTFVPRSIKIVDVSGTNAAQISSAGYLYALVKGEILHNVGVALASTPVVAVGGNDYSGTLKVIKVDANGHITTNINGTVSTDISTISNDFTRHLGKVVLTDVGGNPVQIGSDWGLVNDLLVSSCKDSSGNFGPIRSDVDGRVLVTLVNAGTDTERSTIGLASGTSYIGKIRLHDGTRDSLIETTGALDTIFKDATGVLELAKAGTAHSATPISLLVMGSDGTSSRALQTDTSGNLKVIGAKTLTHQAISVSASGNTTIRASTLGSKVKVISYVLVAGGTVNVKFVESVGTDLTGAMPLVANSGVSFAGGSHLSYCMETPTSSGLQINLSAAVQVSGHITYIVEP